MPLQFREAGGKCGKKIAMIHTGYMGILNWLGSQGTGS